MSSPLIHVAALDVERGYDLAFNGWYDSEFLPNVLARSGWSAARRYECLEGEPRYLTVFDLAPEALESSAPAPFRPAAFSRRIRDYSARTWRRIFEAGADPAAAELINMITVEIDPDHAEPFDRWYSEKHSPEIIACPGWLGGERYESAGGEPWFLAMYGLEDEERPFGTPEYESVVGWDEHVDHIRGYHGFRIYRLMSQLGGPI